MKREIMSVPGAVFDCRCPGHDTWPCETYSNRRSKRARARDKKLEHRYARRVLNNLARKEAKGSTDA